MRPWGVLAAATLLSVSALATGHGLAAAGDGSGVAPLRDLAPLRFDSERIRLGLAGDSIEVRGTYVLACGQEMTRSISLFYPFPVDSALGGARMVALDGRVGGGDLFPLRWEAISPRVPGVRWHIPPCAGDTIRIEAVYRQRTTPGYLRYIVTTTRAWGRPLRRARFEVRLPREASSPSFSFPFERRDASDSCLWTFEAEQFLPDRDIVVRWRPRQP